jgi:aconitate hydratase
MSPKAFLQQYGKVDQGPPAWRKIKAKKSDLFRFDERSTYIQEPPFFTTMTRDVATITPIDAAVPLAVLGDSVTTDHISPAGNIKADSPAGRYLQEHGVQQADFNQYGARRGNDRVMTRGTFANIRLRNLLVEQEGGYTRYLPSGETMAIYDAAMRYAEAKTPLCVIAGKEYGTGSSRDWAAKGAFLLGVRFVLAESYERIHRSNLVGMGVLPLQFRDGENLQTLGLTGTEQFSVAIDDQVQPRQELRVTAVGSDGKRCEFQAICRIDTPVEVDYYRNGGILQTVIRKLLREGDDKPVQAKKVAKKAKPKAKPAAKAKAKPVVKAKAKPVAKAKAKAKPVAKAKPAAKSKAKPVAKAKAKAKPVAKAKQNAKRR